MATEIDNWFSEWFDSDHYHNLYRHRDWKEAEDFINALFRYLDPPKGSEVLDLACGKGRHAVQVHELGYRVCGVDLSEESIQFAKQFEEEGLDFFRGDMRELDFDRKFDITLNLFTSFGYFKSKAEDLAVLKGLKTHLHKGGKIVIDYLNVSKASKELPNREVIERDELKFQIHKQLEDGFIIKDIAFAAEDGEHRFREFVKYLERKDFIQYFEECDLKMVDCFGDYQLQSFDEENSPRLIMILEPK